jgi:hypothetical protein
MEGMGVWREWRLTFEKGGLEWAGKEKEGLNNNVLA